MSVRALRYLFRVLTPYSTCPGHPDWSDHAYSKFFREPEKDAGIGAIRPNPGHHPRYEAGSLTEYPIGNKMNYCTSSARRFDCRIGLLSISAALIVSASTLAHADEGGTSFWLPGQYGSFAAVAPDLGFSLALVSYGYSASGSGSRPLDFGGDLKLGVDARYFGQFIVPAYTPDITIWGGRPSFSLAFIPAYNSVSADVSIAGAPPVSAQDSVTGMSDLYPTAQLFWNRGVHNYMTYIAGNVPIGDYDPNRLSNLGLGHWAVDVGGAYTYLNPETGWEFSATAGLTYNFRNSDTGYKNGIDFHLDLGVGKFVSETTFIGLVGFAYQQITADEGQNPILGDFKGQTIAIGPQVGWFFDAGGVPIYANLRGYVELETDSRVEGRGAMLTLSFPL